MKNNTIYVVSIVQTDGFGDSISNRAFYSYEEAENYAEEQIEKAEEEYGTIVDREQNVYAVLTNNMQDWNGFIEISNVVLPSEAR